MDEKAILNNEKKPTVWTRNFLILFISAFIINFGHSLTSNLLPKYLNMIGLTGTMIGFIISLFSFTALGFRPVSGPLIDGWNKKKLYIIMLVILGHTGATPSHPRCR